MEKIRLLLIVGLIVLASEAFAQCTDDDVYSSSDCLNEQLESNPESVNFDKVSSSSMKEIDNPNKIPDDVLEKRMHELDGAQIKELDKETLDDIDVKTFNDNPEVLESMTDEQLNNLPQDTVKKLSPLALNQGTPSVASRLGITIKGNVRDDCAAKDSGGKYVLNCGGGDIDLSSEFEFGDDDSIIVDDGTSTTTFDGTGDLREDEEGISGTGDWAITVDSGGSTTSLSGSGDFTLGPDGGVSGEGTWDYSDGANGITASGAGSFSATATGLLEVDGDSPWAVTMPDVLGNPVDFIGTGSLNALGNSIEGSGDWQTEDPSNPGQYIDMKDSSFHVTEYGLAISYATIDGQDVEKSFKFTEEGRQIFQDILADPEIYAGDVVDMEQLYLKLSEKYGDTIMDLVEFADAEEGSYLHCIMQMALDSATQDVLDGFDDEPETPPPTGGGLITFPSEPFTEDEYNQIVNDHPELYSQFLDIIKDNPDLVDGNGMLDMDKVTEYVNSQTESPYSYDVLKATVDKWNHDTPSYMDPPVEPTTPPDYPDYYSDDYVGGMEDYYGSDPNPEIPGDLTPDDTWANFVDGDDELLLTAPVLDAGLSEPEPKKKNIVGGTHTFTFGYGTDEELVVSMLGGESVKPNEKLLMGIPEHGLHTTTFDGNELKFGEYIASGSVASDPIDFALRVLEKLLIDFNSDGIDDLAIKLLSVDSIIMSTFKFTLLTPRKLLDNEGISTYGSISEFQDDFGNELTNGENVFIAKTISGSHADKLEDMNGAAFENVDNFTVYADGSVVDSADSVNDSGGNQYTDVLDFEYLVRDDVTNVKFEEASQITLEDGSVINDVENAELEYNTTTGDLLSVSIESSVDDNSFSIESPEGMEIAISELDEGEVIEWDSRDVEFAIRVRGSVKAGFIPIAEFKSNGLFGELTFEEFEDHIFYRFRNGNLSIVDLEVGYDEYISTENIEGFTTAEVYYDYGVRCQNLSKDSMYEYRHDKRNNSFAVRSLDNYKLCVRKKISQNPYDMFDNPLAQNIGYADLVEDMYFLSSMVEYLEPYKESYILKEIYEGKDIGNKMMFSKASNMFNIENMSVQNFVPQKGALSTVHSGFFNIVETFISDSLQRYLKITDNYPDVVQRYASYYHPSFILIENRTLMQESINKEGSVTKVTVFSPDMEDNFVEEVIVRTEEDNFFSKLFGFK